MQKYRCANDIFGYCAGEPETIERPTVFYYTEVTGKRVGYTGIVAACFKSKNTCGLYRTLIEILTPQQQKALV